MKPFHRLAASIFAPLTVAACISLAACGGGGGGSSPTGNASGVLPVANPQSVITPPPIANPVPIQTQGTILGLFGGGFTLNTTTSHGKINVFTSSATITGAAPFVGEGVTVSGNGSWSQAIIATSVAQVSSTSTNASPSPGPVVSPTAQPTSSGPGIGIPSGIVSTQGTVLGTRTGGYTVDQGYPYGKIPVMANASTTIIGGAIGAGSIVQITGTGSVHSGMTATTITVVPSAPSSVTASGTIAAATSYGFTLNVDVAHPAVPVIVNSSVVVGGGAMQVGSMARVTGPGSTGLSITPVQIVVSNPTPQPSPNATPTPTPGPIAQTHVLSADYLGYPYGSTTVSYATAAQYLNWAEVSSSNANAISAAGIKTELYMDPNHVQTNDPLYTSDMSTFAHDCSGNRITTVYNGTIVQYIMDVQASTFQNLYASQVTRTANGGHYDAVFEDNAGPLGGQTGLSGMPCNYNDASWIAGEEQMEATIPLPTIFNGLSGFNGHSPSQSLQLLSNASTIGGNLEHCYSDDVTPEASNWVWTATENTELAVAGRHKFFQCMARNTLPASTQYAARIYAMASFLLTYDPSTSIYWSEFGTPSNFHVMPEQQIVALNPVVGEPSDVSALQMNGGAYGREYRACYVAGQFAGPCAIAVNPDSALQHAFPFPQYGHTLALNGNGLVDGGTLSTQGAAAPTYMAPSSAVIAFP